MRTFLINGRPMTRSQMTRDLPQLVGENGETEWMEDAACKGMGTELFFPDRNDPKLYKPHCNGMVVPKTKGESIPPCPVKRECFEYAIINNEEDGIWGGLGIKGRRRFLNQMKAGKKTIEDL